jgi:glycosyltransferase involved in cell wall biosynthesis
MGSDSVTVRFLDFFNRWLFKHARKIIVVGRDMAEVITRKAAGLDVPVAMIPNWAEIEDVVPRSRAESSLINELGIGDKLIVLHAGNIGHPTDVDSVIECFNLLNGDPRFHFVFVGSGVKRRMLEEVAELGRFGGLTLLESRPRSEQVEFLNACDIGLISLVDGMLGAAMPSKTYNLMAAGKPLLAITHPDSELARMIDEEGIGWHLKPGNPQLLKTALEEIYKQRGSLVEIGRRARLAAESRYSVKLALNRYATELQ